MRDPNALVLHCGAQPATRDAVALIDAPAPTDTWFPVKHSRFLESVEGALENSGFRVINEKFGLNRDGDQFFGTLLLDSPVVPGCNVAVGLRNSMDKSLPLSFCAGSQVFVCDNLAFNAELLRRRKHTRFGLDHFDRDIMQAVQDLHQFQNAERGRLEWMQNAEVVGTEADHLILRGLEEGVISTRNILPVVQQWRTPNHPEFEPRTRWSLFNAFTEVMKPQAERNPTEFALRTQKLHALLGKPVELGSPEAN